MTFLGWSGNCKMQFLSRKKKISLGRKLDDAAATDRIAIKKHLELPFIKKGLSPSFPPLKIPP